MKQRNMVDYGSSAKLALGNTPGMHQHGEHCDVANPSDEARTVATHAQKDPLAHTLFRRVARYGPMRGTTRKKHQQTTNQSRRRTTPARNHRHCCHANQTTIKLLEDCSAKSPVFSASVACVSVSFLGRL